MLGDTQRILEFALFLMWLDSRKQVWNYYIILALYQKPHQPQNLDWTLDLPFQTQIILPYV